MLPGSKRNGIVPRARASCPLMYVNKKPSRSASAKTVGRRRREERSTFQCMGMPARQGRAAADILNSGMSNRRFLFLCVCSALVPAVQPGRAAEADALGITANIQARHLPFGTILDPIFTLTDSDQVAGY